MKIVIAPDSFKGTMSSKKAARWIETRLRFRYPDAKYVHLPLGDGGEGTVNAILSSLPPFAIVTTKICDTVDPIGRPLQAKYYIVESEGNRYALMESAAAGGLCLVSPRERDIMKADSTGVGLMIEDAAMQDVDEIVIGMGGTAFCDGGSGALGALLFSDAEVDSKHFTLLCDVDSPFCGPQGAAFTFAMQKGASRSQLPPLDRALREKAEKYKNLSGVDVSDMPFAGAAGGLAGMLMALYDSTPVRGIRKVLDMIGFEKALEGADLVVTGEGCADASTLAGKAPMGVLEAVRDFCSRNGREQIPVLLMPGSFNDDAKDALEKAGFLLSL